MRVIEVPWTIPPLYEQMLKGDGIASQSAFAQMSATEEPFLVSYYQSPAMAETLRRVTGDGFDLIVIENTFMARFLPDLPAPNPKVLVLHNVLTLMERRRSEGFAREQRFQADAERMEKFEKWAASQCACCVAVSESEAAAARQYLGAERVEIIPNGVDVRFFVPSTDPIVPASLLFTGSMNYWPNILAMQYFCREIFPRIVSKNARSQLHIVGTSPTEEVKALASDRVAIHGAVPDMRRIMRGPLSLSCRFWTAEERDSRFWRRQLAGKPLSRLR